MADSYRGAIAGSLDRGPASQAPGGGTTLVRTFPDAEAVGEALAAQIVAGVDGLDRTAAVRPGLPRRP